MGVGGANSVDRNTISKILSGACREEGGSREKPRRQLLGAWVCESSLSRGFPKQPLIWERSSRRAPNSLQLCPSPFSWSSVGIHLGCHLRQGSGHLEWFIFMLICPRYLGTWGWGWGRQELAQRKDSLFKKKIILTLTFFFFFLVTPDGLQDLRFLTRDWTGALSNESAKP